MFKRYIDIRMRSESDPSGVNTHHYILEVQHQFIFKYWLPVIVDKDLDNIITLTRQLKLKHNI